MTGAIVGCIITMLIVMILCMKGVTPLLCAPFAVIGICLSSGMSVTEGLFTTFAGGVGGMITSLILFFTVSTMFADLMQKTGSADSIGNFLVKLIGEKHAPICIILICGVLMLSGLGIGGIIISFSIGQNLFKRANYTRNVIYACVYAGTSFSALPFIATSNNMLGANFFGGDASAGWLLGLVTTACLFVGSAVILEVWVRKCQKNGEGYEEVEGVGIAIRDEKDCPHIIAAVLPVVTPVILYSMLKWNVIICVVVGAVLCVILNYKQYSLKEWYALVVNGLVGGVIPTMNFAFMGAIGTVIAATPMYASLIEYLRESTMSPYLLTAVATNVIAFFIGSVVPTYNVVGVSMAPVLTEICMAQGLSVGNLQRVFLQAPCVFDSLPTSGGIISVCSMFKVPMKKAYPPVFAVGVLLTAVIVFAVMVPLAGVLPG